MTIRPFVISQIPELFMQIIPSISVTLEYVILSFVLALFFGFLVALMKIGKNKILRAIAYVYTTIMRCTPSVVLLFLVYYGLPRIIEAACGYTLDPAGKVKFVVITLTLFSTASLSEVYRAAYESLDKVQLEAADSIGMTRKQSFVNIFIPQMLSQMIPNLCNTVLILLKEGALAYTIGLIDLLGKGNYIIGFHLGAYALETYVTLVIIYWPLSLLITAFSNRMEKNFDYSGAGLSARMKKGGRLKDAA